MSILHVDSVFKSYKENRILTDIFVSCKKGEIIGLVGRNGSGKSTLMQIIFGSLNAENKFIKIDNKKVENLFLSSRKIKYLPQNSFLPNHIKTEKIIDLFCNKKSADLIKNHKFFRHLLKRKSKELSGGEKRLLEIYLIVYSDAEFVLIDEPFNGIAPIYKDEIKKIIKEQADKKGFIITDHDYYNILDLSSRVILLHDGGTKIVKSSNDLKKYGYLSYSFEV